jgi:rhodanese-related sulfurtransferase
VQSHIPSSILILSNVLENKEIKKSPDKTTDIFVYCRSGSWSVIAVKTLLIL